MRLLSPLVLLPLLAQVLAQDRVTDNAKAGGRFDYQSDVARLRKIVIESLYSNRDVFLRELVSNANDAIEKYRATSLSAGVVDSNPLNITLTIIPDDSGKGKRIVISDTGIGMTVDELTKNLGTLAKSGTSDFLAAAEASKGSGKDADVNLIGQFGLGFYSSFLVAKDVYVASVPAPTKENPNPVQHVFSSSSDASAFDIYPDPRGNTLGRGTEITLVLKDDAEEYLEEKKIRDLIEKHSAFSTVHPIYLWTTKDEVVPLEPGDEGYVEPKTEEEKAQEEAEEAAKEKPVEDDMDIVVEDVKDETTTEEQATQTKTITKQVWDHLNSQPPLWMRDPKSISNEQYNEFYRATFKDHNNPIAWHHFKGDTGSGTGFRAMFFLPPEIPKSFWESPKSLPDNVRLFVKRVFITGDLGENSLPKWISWIRAIVDADDLPLNVSRENLQTTKFMAQVKTVLIKRFIQVMTQISRDDEPKYKRLIKGGYGPILKLAAIEAPPKEQKKIIGLIKFASSTREMVTLDQYLEQRKQGQKQIFYLASIGEPTDKMAKSVFVEKLTARGYEVLLMNEPMDEVLFTQVKQWKDFDMQDVAKDGLQFGDEADDEDETANETETKTKYEPLMKYLKEAAKDSVADVVLTNRLVTSPCAIVASSYGYSGNMQKLMAAQHTKDSQQEMMTNWAKKQRNLEINPRSPLISGLLAKVIEYNDHPEGEEGDEALGEELKEVASIMIDGALVRSGYEVVDNTLFFERMDRVLRRSLGVSESAKADATVKPAPEVVQPETEEKKRSEETETPEAVENLAEDVNLADVDINGEKILKEKPFDTSKAMKVDLDDSGSGQKVGIIPQDGSKWDGNSWEDKLEGGGFMDIEKLMKLANAEDENKPEPAHDEL